MKKLSTDPTPANIATILELFPTIPQRMAVATHGYSNEALAHPLMEGERSTVEVLAHLINSEARSSEAIYLALLTKEPFMIEVHSERAWGKLLRYDLLPFSDLLAYFTLRRTVLMRVLIPLKETQWQRTVRDENKARQESVYWKCRSLLLHELAHTEEIEQRLTGNWE